jgi:hypothetical protein
MAGTWYKRFSTIACEACEAARIAAAEGTA